MASKTTKKKNKLFRKEYIPIVVAGLILVLLIVALIITIINKPKKNDQPIAQESKLTIEEKVVPSNKCEGEEILNLIKETEKLEPYYEVNDHVVFGKGQDLDDPDSVEEDVIGYGLDFYVYNVPDNIRLIITSDQDDKVRYFEKDGDDDAFFVTFTETTFLRVVTVRAYSTLESCEGVLLREFSFTLPRWNELFKLPMCDQPTLKGTEYCEIFINKPYGLDKDIKEAQAYVKKVQNEKEEEEKKEQEKNNTIVIIIVAIIVVIVVGVVVVIIMKGRRKKWTE